MEPQERRIDSPSHMRRRTKTFRLGKTTLRGSVHVQTVGLDAETKKDRHRAKRGDFSPDIPLYTTLPIFSDNPGSTEASRARQAVSSAGVRHRGRRRECQAHPRED